MDTLAVSMPTSIQPLPQPTPSRKRSTPKRSPLMLVDEIIAAILPLVDCNGREPKVCASRLAQAEALAPVIGHYTISDAVLAHSLLEPMTYAPLCPGGGDEIKEAAFAIRETLTWFVCAAGASGPGCVAARAYLVMREREEGTDFCGEGETAVARRMLDDVAALRSKTFRSQRFDDLEGPFGWFRCYAAADGESNDGEREE